MAIKLVPKKEDLDGTPVPVKERGDPDMRFVQGGFEKTTLEKARVGQKRVAKEQKEAAVKTEKIEAQSK